MRERRHCGHPLLQELFPRLLQLHPPPPPPHTADMAGLKVTLVLFVGVGVWALCLGVPQYSPPAPHYSTPAPHYGPAPSYKEPAHPYNYEYSVKDDYKGVNFDAGESSDGQTVKGSYSVDLPDGRKQKVDYTADHYTGYNAEVSYTGGANHPHGSPSPYHRPTPAPHYG